MTTEQTHQQASQQSARNGQDVVDWTDIGREMWSFLTGRNAAIDYQFLDMRVEVPRDTGENAPRATWKLNGTLRVTTSDRESGGSSGSDGTR